MHININEINLGRKGFANRLSKPHLTLKFLSLNFVWARLCVLCVFDEETSNLGTIKRDISIRFKDKEKAQEIKKSGKDCINK